MRRLLLSFFVALAGGCTAEQASRNLYEGARLHDESLKSTPLERPGTPAPAYENYERERRTNSRPRG